MPLLGRKIVDAITTADFMAVLVPIWSTKRKTARRVHQRIGAVMKWSVSHRYRQDNPAGDAIAEALPRDGTSAKTHHRVLPHAEVAGAVEKIRASGASRATVLAFEFLVLAASRSGELRGTRWNKFEFESVTWTVPAVRMKMARRSTRATLGRYRRKERHRWGGPDSVSPERQGRERVLHFDGPAQEDSPRMEATEDLAAARYLRTLREGGAGPLDVPLPPDWAQCRDRSGRVQR